MKLFNAGKALAGAKLITRDGQKATDFGPNGRPNNKLYPYQAKIDGNYFTYTSKGRQMFNEESNIDLFLAEENETVLPSGFHPISESNLRLSRVPYLTLVMDEIGDIKIALISDKESIDKIVEKGYIYYKNTQLI